jgi:hypothetical protein
MTGCLNPRGSACVVSLIAMGRRTDGGRNMPQVYRGIFGAIAVALTFGAVQFASGRDLSGGQQDSAGTPQSAINRAAKADRAVGVAGPAIRTRTISLRLDSLSDTSVLIRIPVAQARKSSFAPLMTKPSDRKMTVACEPVVSVLIEVAKQLQPGRCVT